MWKLLVGFGSVIFFVAMIGLAVYFIKQYLDEKKEVQQQKASPSLPSGDVLADIRHCIGFLSSLSQTKAISGLSELTQEIINPLEKMKSILERYPDKAQNMQDMSEYILPLIKKLADDYCFYHEHSISGDNSKKAMEACEEGLKGMSRVLYTKANGMLEDKFYDTRAEVSALLQLHSIG